ncbi:MAG: copper chaperone PCu(A)C [Burkholderiaceae bacterium]
MNLMRRCIAAGLAAASFAAFAHNHGHRAGDLTIEDAWARASAGGQTNGAAYLKIKNAGATDKLIAASAPVAEVVELHTHAMDGTTMRMRKVDAIDVAGGATTELKPGGLHVMLIGLKAPLKAGTKFPLTLKFDRAGEVKVDVEVRTTAPAQHKH